MISQAAELRTGFKNSITAGLQTVPNSSTDVTTTDTLLFQITVANKSGGAVTLTITDKQSSAKTLIPTLSIAANTVQIYDWPAGVLLKSGMNWVASAASSLDAEICGMYK